VRGFISINHAFVFALFSLDFMYSCKIVSYLIKLTCD